MNRWEPLCVFVFAVAVGMAACQPHTATPQPASGESKTPSIAAVTATPGQADTVTAPAPSCAYIWASEPLPELTAQLEDLFQAADLSGVAVRAEAYGENCVLPDGSVSEFFPMVTDVYLTLSVNDLADEELLGRRLKPALELLADFPSDSLPGSGGFGNVAPVFTTSADERRMLFPFDRAQETLDDGLSGAELIQALANP